MRTIKNILRHEFVGLPCEIVKSSNPSQKGIKGRIIDETLKMITIKNGKGKKNIAKKDTVFRMTLGENKIDIDGNYIILRPEDRIKKNFKRW